MPRRINHQSMPHVRARKALKIDGVMKKLDGKTPQQIKQYVDNNLNDIESIKKFVTMVLLYIQSQ